jgi:uncharacterized protein (TIGR02444 family)
MLLKLSISCVILRQCSYLSHKYNKDDVLKAKFIVSTHKSLLDFAFSYYSEADIANACIHLQDKYSVNICLLIAMRWLDKQERWISDEQIKDIADYIKPWVDEVIIPTRSLRRRLKLPIEPFTRNAVQEQMYLSIKQLELTAEKELLGEIELRLKDESATAKHFGAMENLERYLAPLAPKEFWEILQQDKVEIALKPCPV